MLTCELWANIRILRNYPSPQQPVSDARFSCLKVFLYLHTSKPPEAQAFDLSTTPTVGAAVCERFLSLSTHTTYLVSITEYDWRYGIRGGEYPPAYTYLCAAVRWDVVCSLLVRFMLLLDISIRCLLLFLLVFARFCLFYTPMRD